MLRSIFLKTLRDERKSFMWWGISISSLIILTVFLYHSFAESPAIDEVFQEMPEAFSKLFAGEISDITSPEGYLNSQLFVILIPLVFLFSAIAKGSGAIAGEEEKDTIDLLLSYPVKRSRVVIDKFAAMVVAILSLGLVLWLSVAGSAIAIGMDVSVAKIAEVTLSGGLLGVTFGSLALAMGCAKGNRGLSVGVTSTLGIFSYLINALAPVSDVLEPFQKLSLFYYYIGGDPLTNGLNLGHASVLLGVTVALLGVALAAFEHRDLAK